MFKIYWQEKNNMISLIHQTDLSDKKGADKMPTLDEFKENLLALLDVVNSK